MNRRRLAILFHRFGPYHWARLRAAAGRFELLAVEEAAETAEYAWDLVGGEDGGFRRVTLFAVGACTEVIRRGMVARVEAELDRWQPEAVAIPGWSDRAALAALRWARRRGVPVVVMSESTARDAVRRPWKEWIKRRIVGLCDAALVGGGPHHDYLAMLGMDPARIFLGYDVVDNDHFRAGADAARADPAARTARGLPERYFLASNRFLPQKNLPVLLDAFAEYRRQTGPSAWKLVLLGDGPLRAEIEARRATLGLDDALLLPGFRQYEELPAYYGLAEAFVHTASSEPWGLVVNEALAAGLPAVVSAACGCAPDLIRDGENGFVFEPDDTTRLASGLARVAEASEAERSRMGRASREIIDRWPAGRFADGMEAAVDAAPSTLRAALPQLDRLLLRALLRV